MKKRIYTEGTSVFLSPEMYQAVRKESDDLGISLSELFREMVREYFENSQSSNQQAQIDAGSIAGGENND